MTQADRGAVTSYRSGGSRSRAPLGAAVAIAAGFAAWSPASAADVVLTDLRFQAGPTSYTIPRAEFRGTSLSKEQLQALLSQTGSEPATSRIARIQADEIVVPDMRSEVTAPQKTVTTYRNVVLSKVAGGRIEKATAEGGTIAGETPQGKMSGGLGRMTITGMDLGLAMALMTTKASGPSEPLKTIYQQVTLDGLTFSDDKGHAFRIANIVGNDFAARPTREGWTETALMMSPPKDSKSETPEQKSRRFAALADLFDAFRVGSMEGSGITFGADGKDLGRIDKVGFKGAGDPASLGFRIDGIDVSPPDGGRFRMASYEVGGVSLKPLFDGLAAAPEGDPSNLSQADIRKMIPQIGLLRLTGIEVDLPGEPGSPAAPALAPAPRRTPPGSSAPGSTSESAAGSPTGHEGAPGPSPSTAPTPAARPAGSTSQVTVGSFEVMTAKPVEGIPTDIRIGVKNVAFPVRVAGDNPGARQLASMGYDRVDASFMANLAWNEPGREIVVRELSLEGAGMGSAVVRAVIGGITRQLFAPDTSAAAMSLIGASGKSLELGYEDKGLVERVLASLARDQKRSVEDIRKEYQNVAQVGIPDMLGNAPNARAIGQAIAKFLQKPNRLLITAKAKNPNGFGFTDYMQSPDPASILGSLDVTAVAD